MEYGSYVAAMRPYVELLFKTILENSYHVLYPYLPEN